ncbi:hypothetical protein [Flavobacterium ajazii]|uniref:hypothetical protein n=1 Tax=Flavobacterium ajazii TaxID=2692318 RepID=UPI0013D6F4AF|nr:hypothetical protein [Flavobacterium ajazii]
MLAKKIMLAISVLSLMCFQTINQDSKILIGKWKGEKDPKLSVEFYLGSDGAYYGKISDPTDKYYGKTIFKKMVYDQDENFFSGILNPADKDITLDVTIKIENSNRIKVVAKKFLMTRVITCLKVK